MNTKKRDARIAGWIYLLMAISGGFGIMYFPESILVEGNAFQTAENIRNAGMTYNIAIVAVLVCQVSFLFLVLALDKLLRDVNPRLSKLMIVLVTASVPIAIFNTLSLIGAQWLAEAPAYLSAFSAEQLNGMSLFFIELNEYGIITVEIFWGLWLLPLGLLIIKSKFIPKIIGMLLVVGCFAYLIESLTGLLFPAIRESISPFLMIPLALGEFSIVFWLLIKGVRTVK